MVELARNFTPHIPGLTHLPTKDAADSLRKNLQDVRDLISSLGCDSEVQGDKKTNDIVRAIWRLTDVVEVLLDNSRREAIVSEGKL